MKNIMKNIMKKIKILFKKALNKEVNNKALDMRDVKQVIVMRKDLHMRKGKMIAQGSHASMGVVLRAMRGGKEYCDYSPPEEDYTLSIKMEKNSPMERWLGENFKKITLYVNSEEELIDVYDKAINAGIDSIMIKDSGLTEFSGIPTNTCISIGPYYSEDIDKITGHLKLL